MQVQFVAVCDVDANRLAKAKETVDTANKNSDCRTYGDYREFLEKEKLDAVSDGIARPLAWYYLFRGSKQKNKCIW